jgi:DNA (cytosine-5)-methyltransferase 1
MTTERAAGSRPRLLDLFCGAGGAAVGYHRAGFEVVGVDVAPQPRYPFEFHQADAMTFPLDGFDVIHASPPCQAFTSLRAMHNARPHADLLTPTRGRLVGWGGPYVIENVPGAPVRDPIMLCGSMFGLGVEDAELRRHRLFEVNPPLLLTPRCQHGTRDTIGIYGGHVRNRRRTIGIYGEGVRDSVRKFDKGVPDFTIEQGREAMGITWMTTAELSQAIPPAYTEFIGLELLRALR